MDTTPNPTSENPHKSDSHRDARGRFTKGNPGGSGNPFSRQTARLRQAALDAITPEDIRATLDALKKKALEGDVPAAKLLLSYTIGKPTHAENPDTLDQQEFRNMVANTLESAEGPLNIVQGMPLDLLVQMFRLILPAMRARKAEMAKSVLCAPLTEEEIEANEDDDLQEDDEVDDQQEEDDSAAPDPIDPLANLPEWMLQIGRETKQTPQSKGQQEPRPAEVELDSDLIRVLLKRARNVADLNGQPDPAADALAELLKAAHGPSANGSSGKRPPSANGSNGA